MANEKRLIDAAPYGEFLHQYAQDLTEMDAPMIAGAIGRCLSKLDAQPTVNAVEVPDCKKCIYNEGIANWHQCEHCIAQATNNFVSIEDVRHGG